MILPKVSIITATFNSEKTISDTIDSVLNQTYENIEYIIIDGNSTDNTVSIIKQFEVLDQDGRRLGYAKQLVYSQALQQYKLLRYWFKNREIEQTNQDQLIERLKTIIKMINTCQSLEQLRGLEGASAKIIFYTMSLLVPAWCKFKGRNRRPPRDPINVLLSLSYSLIYAECTRA